jgi:hypothetical protein
MSWDADLYDDRGHLEGDWGYTHNTNGMANAVLDEGHEQFKDKAHKSWWQQLDGLSGPEGAALLNRIITGLEADPDRFRAMNPPNGWGDYDTFLKVLREMRDAVPEWPTQWSASG